MDNKEQHFVVAMWFVLCCALCSVPLLILILLILIQVDNPKILQTPIENVECSVPTWHSALGEHQLTTWYFAFSTSCFRSAQCHLL